MKKRIYDTVTHIETTPERDIREPKNPINPDTVIKVLIAITTIGIVIVVVMVATGYPTLPMWLQ